MDKSCTCEKCVNACKTNPGWFAPGEPEKAAKLLNMSFEDFKKEYLIVDYWVGTNNIYALAPRKIGIDRDKGIASFSYPFKPSPCIFLKNNRCMIHEAKPYECRKAFACDEKSPAIRGGIAQKWKLRPIDKTDNKENNNTAG